jgi:hypothetical protein
MIYIDFNFIYADFDVSVLGLRGRTEGNVILHTTSFCHRGSGSTGKVIKSILSLILFKFKVWEDAKIIQMNFTIFNIG